MANKKRPRAVYRTNCDYPRPPQFAIIQPVDVRAVLAATPVSSDLQTWEKAKAYVKFWLQPQVFAAGRWQGGQQLLIKRVGPNEFKIGALQSMTIEKTAQYVERELDRYRVPYFGSEPWEHPFTYEI